MTDTNVVSHALTADHIWTSSKLDVCSIVAAIALQYSSVIWIERPRSNGPEISYNIQIGLSPRDTHTQVISLVLLYKLPVVTELSAALLRRAT